MSAHRAAIALLLDARAGAQLPPSPEPPPPAPPVDWGNSESVANVGASSEGGGWTSLGIASKAIDGRPPNCPPNSCQEDKVWWFSQSFGGAWPACNAQWLSFSFDEPFALSGYRIWSRSDSPLNENSGFNTACDSPKGWSLQAWDLGTSDWTTVHRVTDQPDWTELEMRDFALPSPVQNQYFRLYFVNSATGHDDMGCVNNIDESRCHVVIAELGQRLRRRILGAEARQWRRRGFFEQCGR